MMESKEWRQRLDVNLMGDWVRELLNDLEFMEQHAIGGEGETHWYYRDECERLEKELADYKARLERYEPAKKD